MLTRLREIVEKVASAPRLNEALDISGDGCLPGDGDGSLLGFTADNDDRRCYYLMATREVKKTSRARSALAFDEGAWWGWLAAGRTP